MAVQWPNFRHTRRVWARPRVKHDKPTARYHLTQVNGQGTGLSRSRVRENGAGASADQPSAASNRGVVKHGSVGEQSTYGGKLTESTGVPLCREPRSKFSQLTKMSGRKKNSGTSSLTQAVEPVANCQVVAIELKSRSGASKLPSILESVEHCYYAQNVSIRVFLDSTPWSFQNGCNFYYILFGLKK